MSEQYKTAEEYLRHRYGAHRGHFDWRALEEAFNAGAISTPSAGAAVPDGWKRPEDGDLITDAKKRSMIEHNGTPGKKMAEAYTVPVFAAPTPPSAQAGEEVKASEELRQVYDAFGIGELARTLPILLTNISNATRRSECLWAIEREFFTKEVPVEDWLAEEPGDTTEECSLSWGASRAEYVEQFRAALADLTQPAAIRSAGPS
ncbi:hypothetical protein ACIPEN_22190, partial [Herbaspirillum chlorophenolicum]